MAFPDLSRVRLLLAASLLALLHAQAVALAHEHLDSHADDVGCELCLAIQGVGGALAATAALPVTRVPDVAPAGPHSVVRVPGPATFWRARAPPASP